MDGVKSGYSAKTADPSTTLLRSSGRDDKGRGNYFSGGWRIGWTELRAATPRRLQIRPLRSCGAPLGMTRRGQLLSGRVATWMDGVKSGYSAKTADPSTTLIAELRSG
jgi:hypothetical protein